MSHNPRQSPEPSQPASEKAWWESSEYEEVGEYVPGQAGAPASSGSEVLDEVRRAQAEPETQPADAHPDTAEPQEPNEAVRAAAERAARELASGPPTAAIPAVQPQDEGVVSAAPAEPADNATKVIEPAQGRRSRGAERLSHPEEPAALAVGASELDADADPVPPTAETLAVPVTDPASSGINAVAPVGASATAPAADATDSTSRADAAASVGVPGVTTEAGLRAQLQGKPVFPRVLQWVVAILTPVVLLVAAIRAVASSGFLWLEYHRPGFPADPYGFSTDQRTTFGSYGLDFINNFAGRDYLGGLVTPSGVQTRAGSKLFLDTEVNHMADVQALVHLAYLVAAIAFVIILISFVILRLRYPGGIRRGLFAGVLVTLGLLLVLGTLGALGWDTFFTDFHRLFFSQGNWEFYLDDTLIRLYPPQFWTDAAIVLGSLILIAVAVILAWTWPTRKRREASKRASVEREFRLSR